ncbi:MAG: putative sugar O-methyltransferase [Flavobacteriales bacterium]|nr:putative sugar O-methyltransferase [Flavobacteriales bacterium]
MKDPHLLKLIEAYEAAPAEFQATSYWQTYKKPILEALDKMDLNQLRSGSYPILASFGFNEFTFNKIGDLGTRTKIAGYAVNKSLVKNETLMPYSIDLSDIREMAYRHCELYGELTHSRPISELEVSAYGNPDDLFEIKGKKYTMQFLGFYIRYCFVNQQINLNGEEVIVELGSGSGHQIELIKKLYPNATVLCFDLPTQLYVCEKYLSQALGGDKVVSSQNCLDWNDLTNIEKGKVHFFGSWQMPLLSDFSFDIFWNAASFGEMEPEVVENYLSYVKGQCQWVYLLQARHGKEAKRVANPIRFEDYDRWLDQYSLVKEEEPYRAHMRLKESGGYFQAVWKKS